jgi:hypothetical protein
MVMFNDDDYPRDNNDEEDEESVWTMLRPSAATMTAPLFSTPQ